MATKPSIYLYAIAATAKAPPRFDCAGIDGQPLKAISAGAVTAVVSPVPNQKLRPERRYLAAHHQVLSHLMQSATVLPMAFGIIADGPSAIARLLQRYRSLFLEQLERVDGKVEMGIRVSWDVPNIFDYFVQNHPELKTTRDQLFASSGSTTRDDMIDLGQLFEQLLSEERETHTEQVVQQITPVCFQIQRNPPKKEWEVMNLACLVGRDQVARFEQAVLVVSETFNDDYLFNYNGPWAPHHFVNINIEL